MEIRNLGNRVVNNYLIPCDEGYILIDTGYENGFRRFQRKLAENGIRPEDIRYVFLTHAHDDHAGFLNDVLAITDAKVILHPLAVGGAEERAEFLQGRLLRPSCLAVLQDPGTGRPWGPQVSCHPG